MSADRRWLLLALALVPGLLTGGLLQLAGRPWAWPAAAVVALLTWSLANALDRQWWRAIDREVNALLELPVGELHLEDTAPLHPSMARFRDTVRRLHAEWRSRSEALEHDAETLRATLEGMAEGLWITDERGTILRTNRALRELLFTTRPLIGERPSALFSDEALDLAVRRACVDRQASTLELSTRGLRPRQLTAFITPLVGQMSGSAAVFRDVTELRRLEKVRKDFVANVSHELRTPITAIRGYAETLQRGALKDAEMAPRMVEIIHRQSERLSELVEDLLELSRIEGQELELESTAVDLFQAAQRAAETVRVRASSKQIDLRVDVPERLHVRGDKRAVEQVLLNLMDNAVKYTPAAGRVFVDAKALAGKVQVTVRDTGLGMEPKHLQRIFERFYRVDKGRSRDMGGTGLGLSIVKHLVGAMGGDVRAESKLQVGTTFTLSLTKADAPPTKAG
jgi:two-component system phosphate regulon sensor histidine kinase PhoR